MSPTILLVAFSAFAGSFMGSKASQATIDVLAAGPSAFGTARRFFQNLPRVRLVFARPADVLITPTYAMPNKASVIDSFGNVEASPVGGVAG